MPRDGNNVTQQIRMVVFTERGRWTSEAGGDIYIYIYTQMLTTLCMGIF